MENKADLKELSPARYKPIVHRKPLLHKLVGLVYVSECHLVTIRDQGKKITRDTDISQGQASESLESVVNFT